jgi:hypothetical protein
MNESIISPLVPPLRGSNATPDTFRTESLELASYLLARGHRLIGTDRDDRMIIFVFPGEASSDTASFFDASVALPPIKIFEAHRSLRMMVNMVRNSGVGGSSRQRSRGGVA